MALMLSARLLRLTAVVAGVVVSFYLTVVLLLVLLVLAFVCVCVT
jgi:hypothetical protein